MKALKKNIVKELKKERVSKEVLKQIKKANSEVEIGKILIEQDQFDLLVKLFHYSDAVEMIDYYVDSAYPIDSADIILKSCNYDIDLADKKIDEITQITEQIRKQMFKKLNIALERQKLQGNLYDDSEWLKKHTDGIESMYQRNDDYRVERLSQCQRGGTVMKPK